MVLLVFEYYPFFGGAGSIFTGIIDTLFLFSSSFFPFYCVMLFLCSFLAYYSLSSLSVAMYCRLNPPMTFAFFLSFFRNTLLTFIVK